MCPRGQLCALQEELSSKKQEERANEVKAGKGAKLSEIENGSLLCSRPLLLHWLSSHPSVFGQRNPTPLMLSLRECSEQVAQTSEEGEPAS